MVFLKKYMAGCLALVALTVMQSEALTNKMYKMTAEEAESMDNKTLNLDVLKSLKDKGQSQFGDLELRQQAKAHVQALLKKEKEKLLKAVDKMDPSQLQKLLETVKEQIKESVNKLA